MTTCRRHSFTLLELLVASLTAAVLISALLVAMSSAWKLQEQSHRRTTMEIPRAEAMRILRNDLRQALPPAGILAEPMLAEMGESGDYRSDDVEWVTATGTTRPDLLQAPFAKVHYYLAEATDSDTYALVRTHTPMLPAMDVEDEPEEQVLLAGVAGFEATWYDGTDWVDSWDSTVEENALPTAARIRIDFAAASRPQRPIEFIVPFDARTPSSEESDQ